MKTTSDIARDNKIAHDKAERKTKDQENLGQDLAEVSKWYFETIKPAELKARLEHAPGKERTILQSFKEREAHEEFFTNMIPVMKEWKREQARLKAEKERTHP